MKFCLVGAELFHADGQTDRQTDITKPNSRFSQFCARAKKNRAHTMYVFVINRNALFLQLEIQDRGSNSSLRLFSRFNVAKKSMLAIEQENKFCVAKVFPNSVVLFFEHTLG